MRQDRQTDTTKLFAILRTHLKRKGKEREKDGCNYVFDPRFIFLCKAHWLFVAFTSSHFQNLRQYCIFEVSHSLVYTIKVKDQNTTVEGS